MQAEPFCPAPQDSHTSRIRDDDRCYSSANLYPFNNIYMRIEIQSLRKTSDSRIRNHENNPPDPFSAMSVLTVPVPVGCSSEPSPHRHITPHRATCGHAGAYGRVSSIVISTRTRRVGTRSRRNSASASPIYTSSASNTGG